MIVKYKRVLFHPEHGKHEIVKGGPWNCAEIIMYKDDKYIAFLIKRELLLTNKFKKYYYRCKNKLDNYTKDDL